MSNFKTQQVDIKTADGTSQSVLPQTGHILPYLGPITSGNEYFSISSFFGGYSGDLVLYASGPFYNPKNQITIANGGVYNNVTFNNVGINQYYDYDLSQWFYTITIYGDNGYNGNNFLGSGFFVNSSIPAPDGWVLCDGTNGTPDLRGKIPGGKSSIAVGSNEIHTHSITVNLGAFSSSSLTHNNTINAANTGNNSNNHTHSVSASVYINAWGDSGPANRATGTQANVIGRTHTHGGTTSANATGIGSAAQNANHSHGYSTYAVNATTGNSHSHDISYQPTIIDQIPLENNLPSIFYVNFIMKV